MTKKTPRKTIKHLLARKKFAQRSIAILFIIVFAGIGVRILSETHAAAPYSTAEAESGTVAAPASKQSSTATSGGQYVLFGNGSSGGSMIPTPTSLDSTFKSVNFDDEFSGTSLNTSKWETCIWYDPCHSADDISDAHGGTADPANVSVNNGLTLAASSSTPTVASSWGDGYIDSAPYYQTPDGNYYVEIKAKLPPPAAGLWPALVLYEDGYLPPTKPYPYAEMDILERVSQPQSNGTINPPTAFQSWHNNGFVVNIANELGGLGVDLTSWNTYGVEVSSSGTMTFWFNNTQTGSPIAGGPNAAEGMFINVALTTGGTPNDGWAGVPTAATPSPSSMNVAYVRVFTP